jgi:hypothetical protein
MSEVDYLTNASHVCENPLRVLSGEMIEGLHDLIGDMIWSAMKGACGRVFASSW